MPDIFISSCTRRQLARRRPSVMRLQAQLWLLTLVATAIGVVLTFRGVI
jgi:hypothetical protein